MYMENRIRPSRIESWLRVLLVIATMFSVLGFAQTTFAREFVSVTGHAPVVDPSAPGCDDPEGAGFDLIQDFSGDLLKGCLYVFIEVSECNPDGTYFESGRDVYVGSGQPGDSGTFETTYTYSAKFEDCNTFEGAISGVCHHPIIANSGTGDFEGITGRLKIVDNVVTGNHRYTGQIFVGEAPNQESFRVNRRNVTIPWFGWISPPPNKLTHDMCPAIPEGYEIVNDDLSNLRRKVGSVRELPNGRQVLRVRDVVRGTATDNFGNEYNWIYRQNLSISLVDGVATAVMTDYFRVGGGPAAHELGFKFKWQYETDQLAIGEEVVSGELIDFYGDFIWPTDDGVTETSNPDFVPGSWQIFYDYGDWAHCDPV